MPYLYDLTHWCETNERKIKIKMKIKRAPFETLKRLTALNSYKAITSLSFSFAFCVRKKNVIVLLPLALVPLPFNIFHSSFDGGICQRKEEGNQVC